MIFAISGRARAGKDTAAEIIVEELGGVRLGLADPIKRFCHRLWGDTTTLDHWWGSRKEEPIPPPPYSPPVVLVDCVFAAFAPYSLGDATFLPRELCDWVNSLPEKLTPRIAMQRFGTEWGRKVSQSLWADMGVWYARQLLNGGHRYTGQGGLEPDEKMSYNAVAVSDIRFRNELLAFDASMRTIAVRVIRPDNQKGNAVPQHSSETEQGTMPDWWFDKVFVNAGGYELYKTQVRNWVRETFGPWEKSP